MSPVEYSKAVARMIRVLREARDISMSEMAKAMIMSQSGWSRVETGETDLTIRRLFKAAKILNMTPSALLKHVDTTLFAGVIK